MTTDQHDRIVTYGYQQAASGHRARYDIPEIEAGVGEPVAATDRLAALQAAYEGHYAERTHTREVAV